MPVFDFNRLNFCLNTEYDVWNYLKDSNKPIVMYGTGNGADKILDIFEDYGINVSEIFTSDEFFKERTFRGFSVKRFSEIVDKYNDFIIVLAFAVFREDMLSKIKDKMAGYELIAPCVSVFGNDFFSLRTLSEHVDDINKAYSLLEDSASKDVFISSLEYRLSGDPRYLFSCESDRRDVFENIFKLGKNEYFIDLGAYRGDTIEEFLSMTSCEFEKILALEPDIKNYKKCIEYVESLPDDISAKITAVNKASWCDERILNFCGGGGRNSNLGIGDEFVHTVAVDSIADGVPTYIKMDVEGAELETLEGLKHTLSSCKPKLSVSAYHRVTDLFTLPLKIKELNPDYKIFLRHHPYIPDWESNYYCY